jgi:predicted aspartyl protease
MPIISQQIRVSRCLIEVAVGLRQDAIDERRAAGNATPSLEVCYALIDTGAQVSVIDLSIVERLGPVASNTSWMSVPGAAPKHCSVYPVTIHIGVTAGDVRKIDVVAAATTLGDPAYRAVIGMDVLSKGLLVVNGPEHGFLLAL